MANVTTPILNYVMLLLLLCGSLQKSLQKSGVAACKQFFSGRECEELRKIVVSRDEFLGLIDKLRTN